MVNCCSVSSDLRVQNWVQRILIEELRTKIKYAVFVQLIMNQIKFATIQKQYCLQIFMMYLAYKNTPTDIKEKIWESHTFTK